MADYREIGETLSSEVDAVLEQWDHRTKDEPWLSLPAEYKLDHLPLVIQKLAAATLIDPDDETTLRELVEAAAENGHHRLQMGFSDSLIFTEYQLLRESVWSYLRQRFPADDTLSSSVLRLESGATIALMAALRGYHRTLFESRGDWPGTLDALVRRWRPALRDSN